MAGAHHGLRYALSRDQVIELWIDSRTADELAGRTVTVAVLRGIAQALPARVDPWFRHKLRRAPLPAAAGNGGLGSIRETKLEFILAPSLHIRLPSWRPLISAGAGRGWRSGPGLPTPFARPCVQRRRQWWSARPASSISVCGRAA